LSYTSADRLRWQVAEYSNRIPSGKADPRKLPTTDEFQRFASHNTTVSRSITAATRPVFTFRGPGTGSIPLCSAALGCDISFSSRSQESRKNDAPQSSSISQGS